MSLKRKASDEEEESVAPIHLENAFDPEKLCGGDPNGWSCVLKGLSSKLPVQMHMEPKDINDEDAPPMFKRCVKMLRTKPELADQLDVKRARIKLRLSGGGKFVHRNRYRRRNIICCLQGEQWWLFLQTLEKNEAGELIADKYLNATSNDNWNGFRSNRFPTTLTVDQMREIAAAQPPNVQTKVVKLKAGDIMTFDGRWWHATQYDDPVLNAFFTPGKDMEVAVKEHKRRMAMPFQKNLKIATINMAKCARLGSNWQKDALGEKVDWEGMDKNTATSAAAEEKK